MSDVDHRGAQFPVQSHDQQTQFTACERVKMGKRLIEEKYIGPAYNGARQCDALTFSTRQFLWQPCHPSLKTNGFRCFRNPPLNVVGGCAAKLRPERDVLARGQVWEKRVILKNHRNISLVRLRAIGDNSIEADASTGK
ncbi:MAG TPA: hypothetical protein VK530_14555 [Candidatus Acidoferrum sp.]|nr:hypothetical protein [Candidatus Acidoferrum sp.]